MFRKPVFWILLVVILGLAGGGYYYYTTTLAKPVAAASTPTLQTATVRNGNIIISALGSGTLTPASSVNVAFAKSGTLAEVDIKVGDNVKAGQVIAKQGNLESLDATIATDKLNVLTAQQALDALYQNLETDRANAQAALVTAEKNLTTANYTRDIYNTQRCSTASVTLYYGDLVTAQNNYDKINNDFLTNYVRYPENDARRINAYSKLYNAQVALNNALATYNYCTGNSDSWTTQDNAAQAAAAQAAYNVAQANMNALKDGPDPVALAQAQAKLDSAKYQLSVDTTSLSETTLLAPISGVVTAVNNAVGETTSGTFTTIADNLHPKILTYMDQTDLNSFQLNYAVTVTFDALPSQTFTGKVTQIAPALVNQSGNSYVQGTVTIDDNFIPTVSKLPSGMTASVEVISGQANNTLLVPVAALRELSAGNYAVFVVGPNEQLTLTPIKVGLMDLTNAQVLSGLKGRRCSLDRNDNREVHNRHWDNDGNRAIMSTQSIIELVDVTKVYGAGDIRVVALDKVNLKIAEGEFIAIMGPSGSGKSTLMNILGCLDRTTSGTYMLAGEDVSNLNRAQLADIRNRRLGFIFQSYNLLSRTRAIENVIMPMEYDRRDHRSGSERQKAAMKSLELVGLGDRARHFPNQLSGGQQQRVAIARALINEPALILADEPTGNLDSHSGDEIMELLSELNRQGRTIVMVTHDEDIAHYTKRVVVIRDGKVESDLLNGHRVRPVLEVNNELT